MILDTEEMNVSMAGTITSQTTTIIFHFYGALVVLKHGVLVKIVTLGLKKVEVSRDCRAAHQLRRLTRLQWSSLN